jgi:hypothetical protein
MAEFFKCNVDLDEPSMATVRVRIRPSSGIWAAKEKSKEVPVKVIGR